ncbi:hypothetical protein [Cupriavidus pampae]|uniref:Uncharacterized protein n=1 Tax=Cupriavidus pampae TaxID=659251 RepID=A0ABM8Y088_9BURK|nr:hypothetical protein [Cupriavidus pampae]CAG9186055.1 hypothetical protein LMG32289_06238 [Cupriavidus pampae]
MQKIVLSTVVALSLAACASAATESQHQTLVGEIHIKGNDPFPAIMLETAAHDMWELVGMSLADARALVGKQATVEGAVLRAPGPGVWLPSMRVRSSAAPP